MSTTVPRRLQEISYHAAAQKYLASLPLEHFMGATPQATQRKITLASLELVHARRPDVEYFNELLVQQRRRNEPDYVQVVPDNMVVIHPAASQAEGSYDVELQPVRPFWVLEYVSRNNKRKDYEDSFAKYEQLLKVPYFLRFYPETQDLTLNRHNGLQYVTVLPNEHDRFPIPELDLELGLLDGWVRYWYRGELLPLPADLLRELDDTRAQLVAEREQREQETQRAEAAERKAALESQARLALEQEVARFKAQLGQPHP